MKRSLFVLISLWFFCGCAQDLTVVYQDDAAQTGTVVIKTSRRTYQTSVSMNDTLLVDEKNLRSLTIENVPFGEHQIHYIVNSQNLQDKVDERIQLTMSSEKEITKLVEVPPYNNMYWIYQSISIIFPFILFLIMIL
jgi:hypothetical protein